MQVAVPVKDVEVGLVLQHSGGLQHQRQLTECQEPRHIGDLYPPCEMLLLQNAAALPVDHHDAADGVFLLTLRPVGEIDPRHRFYLFGIKAVAKLYTVPQLVLYRFKLFLVHPDLPLSCIVVFITQKCFSPPEQGRALFV